MDVFHILAEAKIREAIDAGMLDDLPGTGKPLQLDDDANVPADLRASYRILKNAGMLPEELELRQSMVRLRDLLAATCDDEEEARLRSELDSLASRFECLVERRRGTAPALGDYRDRVARRLRGGQ
ncbi:MAG: DUF1992 domain-containing protein [Planctomycetes bacterium]|nr:DUF1992 domain-containing protein [Planctomycetota bacterium]MCB9919176.1 DUF1992 domain-containing protein [Planctomycetota bacterium]